MRQTVDTWLAQSVERNDPSGVRVEARVEHEREGFVLDLTLETPSGEARERLVAERCETLAGVVALKVALAADPGAWFEAARDAGARLRSLGLRLTAGLSQSMQPGVGPHLALTGSFELARFGFELGVGYGLPNEARYGARPAIGAKLDTLYGSARVCALPDMGEVAFPICAGADVGFMRGTGFGTTQTSTSIQPMVTMVAGPALRFPLSALVHLWLGLEALLPVVRPAYHIRNLERLFVSDPIAARVQLGCELRFK